jgi:histidinol-phosphate aminotransferase
MARAVDMTRPNIVFIASPNNPTGALMAPDRLEAVIAAAHEALVIIDEAYVDFAPRSQFDAFDVAPSGPGKPALRPEPQLALRRHPNVAVLRTLSKIGFAALRIGWLIAPAALIAELDKVRLPYNVPVPSQRAAALVLRDLGDEIARLVEVVCAERDRLAAGLRALGCDVAPSHANFLWIETRRPAHEVFEALAARGVLVRSFHAAGGRLAHRLRITVGLPSENDRLLTEIASCA